MSNLQTFAKFKLIDDKRNESSAAHLVRHHQVSSVKKDSHLQRQLRDLEQEQYA